ncbi:MAG TPA: hypothetical protein VMU99_02620 [Acidimicrobiales bacterium]|nr:hypothetical protein [Acidimicrobiales bacterium]
MTDHEGTPKKYTEELVGSPITAAPNDAVLIRDLPEGTQVRIRGGDVVEITANPRDGGWLFVKVLESDDFTKIGSDDMAFCVDVIDVVKQIDQ